MRYFHNIIAFSAILFIFLLVFTPGAQAGQKQTLAYLDPGTGALIFQALIAGLVGVSFAVKLFWSNIKRFFLKLTGKEVASEEQRQENVSEVAAQKEDDEQ